MFSKLSFFKIDRYEYKTSHICDFSNIPRPHFCMGLLIKGSAVFTSESGREVPVFPGDIIFVPITSRYISKWKGSPDVLYISMHFAFEPSCGISEKNNFKLQKVTLPDFDSLRQKFSYALECYNSDEMTQTATLGVFFDILSRMLPLLESKKDNDTDLQIKKALDYINLNSEQRINVSHLAEICNMSVPNFYIRFKKSTSMTPIIYKNQVSISRAVRLLKSKEQLSVEQISEMLGFESSTYFRRVFKQLTGKTPSEFKKAKMEL